jgi:type II secretory pathway pseudopilin PulG
LRDVAIDLEGMAVMKSDLRLRNRRITKSQNRQRGYMLITLLFAIALITIALLTVLPDITQQVKRDREEELRHRGSAYMRAIQHFYKKFGRYPMTLDELENTNNLRFLRKRYTDPMSFDLETHKEKDFKLLHQTDINLSNGPVLPAQGLLSGQNGQSLQNGLTASAVAGLQSALAATGGAQGSVIQQTGGLQSPSNGDSNSAGSSSSNSNSGFNGQTFGGGPIFGVASTNKKDKTIRVFFQKNHYSDWQFIYVPQMDRGGLMIGPVNPGFPAGAGVAGAAPAVPANGLPGQSGFGQGFGNAPNNNQTQSPAPQPAPNSPQPPE